MVTYAAGIGKHLSTEFDWDIDFAAVLGMVENEFGVKFTEADVRDIDGSFDSIVGAVAKHLS